MINRFGAGRLNKGKREEEDVNPMDGVGNMADAMLVLAVGIMLALVMNWNVDLSTVSQVQVKAEQEVSNLEDFKGDDKDDAADSSGLTEMGTVYKDPETGKLYMVSE